MRQMKKQKRVWFQFGLQLGAAFLIFGSIGCAARSGVGAEEQLRALEKEVARLTSERANLDARAAMLDDKVVLLEARLKKCGGNEGRALQVVKLSPTQEGDAPDATGAVGADVEAEWDDTPDASLEETVQEGKRPVLVLNAHGDRRTAAAPRRTEGPLAVPTRFEPLGADNLGVVAGDGSTPTPDRSEMARFNEAYRAFSNKQHATALKEFAAFIKENPDHPYADDALYWRGECYLAQGKFLYAVGEFQRLVHRYPGSDKVSSGLYRIGFSYDKLHDFAKAAEFYFEVVERFPGTDAARRAGARVADLKNTTPVGGALLSTSATR